MTARAPIRKSVLHNRKMRQPRALVLLALALVAVAVAVLAQAQGAVATSAPSKSPSRAPSGTPSTSPTAFNNYVMDETVAIVASVLGGLIFGALIVWYVPSK
jgi:hypothetical protein